MTFESASLFYFKHKLYQMGSSQRPLSKHVASLCKMKNHQYIRSAISDLEMIVLHGELPPWVSFKHHNFSC